MDHFEQFSVKFVSQNFPSFRILLYRETTMFLVTLQPLQFTYIFSLKSVKWYIILLHLDSILALAYSAPP